MADPNAASIGKWPLLGGGGSLCKAWPRSPQHSGPGMLYWTSESKQHRMAGEAGRQAGSASSHRQNEDQSAPATNIHSNVGQLWTSVV